MLSNINFWSALSGLMGTILIFFFGIPPRIDPEGQIHLVTGGIDKEEIRKAKYFKYLSYLGILLLALSFLLQIISLS